MLEQLAESASEPSMSTPELDAWMQLTHLILAAVSDHAVHDGETDPELFRQRIQESLLALKDRPTPAQVLTTAGALSQTIANHSAQNQRRIDALLAEVRTLTERAALAQVPSGAAAVDACTGLPNRAEAEAAILRAVAANSRTYVAVFYLHRMNLANVRFGAAISDQVISFCSQQLTASIIKTDDALYRWTGPAFIAILRQESHLRVDEEVQRAASAPASRFFETATRTVYLPIKLTSEVIVTRNQTCAGIIERIEQFILEAAGASAG